MSDSKLSLAAVVAMAENRVIGVENTLPWRLPADLARFKHITLGHPIIMGRLTYDSIGRPLPGRTSIVVTRDPAWHAQEGVLVAHSLDQAITLAEEEARRLGVNRAMIVGGAKIYEQTMHQIDTLFVTEVHTSVSGDAYFPEIDKEVWREKSREEIAADEANSIAYAFVCYEKNA